ncbi:MAG: OsmC family protein [Myxococcota bacterium]
MSTTTTTNHEINDEALHGLVAAVKADTAKAQTVWKAHTKWKGGFRSDAHIRDFAVPMDEPNGLGGGDSAPNMVEMVLGAYGSCLTVGYALNAKMLGIELDDIRIELEGHIDLRGFMGLEDPDEVWPGYRGISVKVNLDSQSATPDQLLALHEQVQRTSPVGSILARPVKIDHQLVING